MSDRSPLQLIVYDCPPEQQEAVLEVMRYHDLSEDLDGHPVERLVLGQMYGYDEAVLGTYAEIAAQLIEKAPGASFRTWNDPKYEWLGAVSMYAPDLGEFQYDCDTDGRPVFNAREIELSLAKVEYERVLVATLFGLPWINRFDALLAAVPA